MRYEINVAKNGKHFFATAERSITTIEQLRAVFKSLLPILREPEYTVSVSCIETVGREMDITEILESQD